MPENGLETPITRGPWPDMATGRLFLSQMVGGSKFSEELPDLIQLTDWLNHIELGAFAYPYFKNWNDPTARMAAAHLEATYWAGVAAASIKLTALEQILQCFLAEGIDCTLIKGIAFGFTIYAEHAVRPMNDIDLWIQKNDLPVVRRLLIEMGYQDGDWLNPENVANYITELSFFPDEPQISQWNIDVQWDLLSKPGLIGFLPLEEWWRRRRSVDFNGLEVRVLDPADALVHVCVHQMLQHRSDLHLRWLLDIDRLVRAREPYWITPAHWQRVKAEFHDSEILPVIQSGLQQAVRWFTTPLSAPAIELMTEPLDFEQKIFYLSYAVPKVTARKMIMTSFHRAGRYRYLAHMMLRSLFPRSKYMMQQYKFSNSILLPLYYGKRIWRGIKIFVRGV